MTFLCTGSYSVSTVEVLLFITTFVPDHRRNLDNNMGERQNRPWVLEILIYEGTKLGRGTQWHSWLTTCWKVAGSISNGVIGIFH